MDTVIIESAGEPARIVQLAGFPCRIGRDRNCAVMLANWRVARAHAELHRLEHGVKIVDCGSLGGSTINGERFVEFGPLSENDVVQIAGFRLRFEMRGAGGDSGASDLPGAESSVGTTATPDGSFSAQPSPANASACGNGSFESHRQLHRRLLARIDLHRHEIRHLGASELRVLTRRLLAEIADEEPALVAAEAREALFDEVLDEAIGLGPIERLLGDGEVSEIMVNGTGAIFVERAGKLERTGLRFSSTEAIRAVIERIVTPIGRRIDDASPMVDARLPDGSRVHAVLDPLAINGPTITIRRFHRRAFDFADLVAFGSASREMLAFLKLCVETRRNIVVSGGTGAGKTTLLNVLSALIGADERLITIEDAAELQLRHPHLVSLEARPANAEGRGEVPIRELVRNALRMRPDRIVVGECRGREALDMLQAMNTGHDGSLTTIHANSARDAISRLEVMVLMAGVEMPVQAIREQIAAAIDIIVQQARMPDGCRRIVEIAEVTGIEGSRVLMQPIFRFDRGDRDCAGVAGRFVACNNVPDFFEGLRSHGRLPDLSVFAGSP
jgi:pilus assembly protein CpaF